MKQLLALDVIFLVMLHWYFLVVVDRIDWSSIHLHSVDCHHGIDWMLRLRVYFHWAYLGHHLFVPVNFRINLIGKKRTSRDWLWSYVLFVQAFPIDSAYLHFYLVVVVVWIRMFSMYEIHPESINERRMYLWTSPWMVFFQLLLGAYHKLSPYLLYYSMLVLRPSSCWMENLEEEKNSWFIDHARWSFVWKLPFFSYRAQ